MTVLKFYFNPVSGNCEYILHHITNLFSAPGQKKPKMATQKKKSRTVKNGPTRMTNGKKSESTSNNKKAGSKKTNLKKQGSGGRTALLKAAASLKKKPSLLKKTSSLTRMASLVKKSSLKRVASVKAGQYHKL